MRVINNLITPSPISSEVYNSKFCSKVYIISLLLLLFFLSFANYYSLSLVIETIETNQLLLYCECVTVLYLQNLLFKYSLSLFHILAWLNNACIQEYMDKKIKNKRNKEKRQFLQLRICNSMVVKGMQRIMTYLSQSTAEDRSDWERRLTTLAIHTAEEALIRACDDASSVNENIFFLF